MLQKQAVERRVTRVIAIIQTSMFSLCIIALVGWIIRHWPEVGAGFKSTLNSLSAWSSSGLTPSVLALVYLCFVLLLINLLLTVRAIVIDGKRK